jgi:hypothetical protein
MNTIKNNTKNKLVTTPSLLQKRLNIKLIGIKKYNDVFYLNNNNCDKILLFENLKNYQVSNLNNNNLMINTKILSSQYNKG